MLSSEGGDWGRIAPGVSTSLISEGVCGLLALLVPRGWPRVGLQGDTGLVMHSPHMESELHGTGRSILAVF